MAHRMYPTKRVSVRWVSPGATHSVSTDLSRYELVDLSVEQLRAVREMLRTAHAPKAAEAVAKAMKSVEGARRHAAHHGWHGKVT